MTGLRGVEGWMRRQLEELRGLELPEDLMERFGPYRGDPAGFVREELGVGDDLQPYQAEILQACADRDKVAWRAGHGVGKTAGLAWILLWWLLTRPFSRILILAPAFERQVGRYLLPEVRKWARHAPDPLPVTVRANSVEVNGFEREWFALGVQASDSTKVEGGHAESLCVLADEAKGLDAEIVAALHGTQTDVGGDRLFFLASVPGGPSGPFYDTFRKGGRRWALFHTSGLDSALVSEAWIEERREEWGEASPLYIARVLGEFPEEDEGTLFALSDLEAAVGRELEEKDTRLRFGVDVARFGNDASALAVWQGKRLLEVRPRRGLDTMEVAAWISSEILRRQPVGVAVDEPGMGGGPIDRLRQLGHQVTGFQPSGRATQPDIFLNRRAEVFWKLREALQKAEVSLPEDDRLLSELSAFRYEHRGDGKIQVEAKDDLKKRLGHSPDLADAAVLGFSLIAGPKKRRRIPSTSYYAASGLSVYHNLTESYARRKLGGRVWRDSRAQRAREADVSRSVNEALIAIHSGQPVNCRGQDWPEVRRALQARAAKWVDAGDDVRAQVALSEVKRLDQKLGRPED